MQGLSLVAASGGHSSSRCAGLSLLQPLLLRSTGSRRAGSVVVAYGPSCSAACGILPDQGANPCPLFPALLTDDLAVIQNIVRRRASLSIICKPAQGHVKMRNDLSRDPRDRWPRHCAGPKGMLARPGTGRGGRAGAPAGPGRLRAAVARRGPGGPVGDSERPGNRGPPHAGLPILLNYYLLSV